MYRAEFPDHGILEFTYDHPFVYEGRYYKFEDLIKIHPVLKETAKEIKMDDEQCPSNCIIFNIINHGDQFHPNNMIPMGENLKMVGGYFNDSRRHLLNKKETLKLYMEAQEEKNQYTIESYIENYKSEEDNKYVLIESV